MHQRKMKILPIMLSLALIMGFAASGCSTNKSEKDSEAAPDQVNVEIAESKIMDIKSEREFSGKLKPSQDIMVVPKMPGKVAKVYVKVGQKVKKGDPLIELEGTDVELQLSQAEAAYDTARISSDMSMKKLDELKDQKKQLDEGIEAVDSGIQEIKGHIKEIDDKLSELKKGLDAKLISKAKYEESKKMLDGQRETLETRKAEMEKKASELQTAGKTIENTIKSLPYSEETLNAQMKQAKAGVEIARNARNNLKVVSPISGVVSALNAEEGEMIAQTMPAVTVIDMSSLLLDINLSEFDVNRIKTGDIAKVMVDAIDEEAESKIDWISPAPDQRTQAYAARIVLENSGKEIKPGMFAKALIITDFRENAVAVPKESIVDDNGKKYIFVITGEKASKKEVKTGIEEGTVVEIISGISAGENVVVRGQDYITDDSKIKVVRGDGE